MKPSCLVVVLAVALGLSSRIHVHAVIHPVNVTNIGFGASYSVAVSGHYAYVATQYGMRTLDISNPIDPVQVGFGGSGTLLVGSDTHLYLLDGNVLHILDISTPSNPVPVGQMQFTNCCCNNLSVSGHYVYPTGVICDVSDPTNPVQVGEITLPPGHSPYGFVASGRYGYMPVNFYGLYVWDISDPTNPRNVGLGTVMNYAFDVAISGHYAYVTAFTNFLQVFDISNPTNPVNLQVYPHASASDNSVAISGNYAYVFGGTSFSVVDISNPTNSTAVFNISGTGNLVGFNTKMAIAGNYAYFPTGDGLSIWSLGIEPPDLSICSTNGTVVLSWPTPTGAFSVQQSSGLNPANWVTLTNVASVVGSENQVTVPSPPANMFYRLISQ